VTTSDELTILAARERADVHVLLQNVHAMDLTRFELLDMITYLAGYTPKGSRHALELIQRTREAAHAGAPCPHTMIDSTGKCRSCQTVFWVDR
jgi:hypothetical protein